MQGNRPPAAPRLIGPLCAGILALLLAGCGEREIKPDANPVVLEVAGETLRLDEVRSRLDYLRERRASAADSKDAFVDDLVGRQAALARARELGLDDDPELQRQMENLLIGRLRQTELEARNAEIEISEEAVRERYEAERERYTRPSQVRIALLRLEKPSGSGSEAINALRKRLREAAAEAADLPEGTRGFGEIAMNHSDEATSRFKGGDVGWLQAGEKLYRWPDPVIETAFALEADRRPSDVVETEDALFVLMRLDARPAVTRDLDERLAAQIRGALLREAREAVVRETEAAWRAAASVTLHESALDELDFSGEKPADNGGHRLSQSMPAP